MLKEMGRRVFHPDEDVSKRFGDMKILDNQWQHANWDKVHDFVFKALRPRLSGEVKCPPSRGEMK